MPKTIITKSASETQKLGKKLAQKVLAGKFQSEKKLPEAVVFALAGELGAGKTTFSQGFLEGLGLQGPFSSPTFIIAKEYVLPGGNFQKAYHIDAYRIAEKDLADLGWKEIVAENKNIVIIEWAENIAAALPENSWRIDFKTTDEKEREITFCF